VERADEGDRDAGAVAGLNGSNHSRMLASRDACASDFSIDGVPATMNGRSWVTCGDSPRSGLTASTAFPAARATECG
jgi:hypothetical protein